MALDKEKREALATIIRESERLRKLALKNGDSTLGFLLENVLHEARKTLLEAGHQLPKLEASGKTIVPFKPR